MKKRILWSIALILLLSFFGAAQAVPINTYYDIKDEDVMMQTGDSFSWHFDLLTDPLFTDWEMTTPTAINDGDTILKAKLRFKVRNWTKPYSDTTLSFDGSGEFNKKIDTGRVKFDVLAYIKDDYKLDVTLKNLSGDFKVKWMLVKGEFENAPESVPEPGISLLLGLGLIGLAGFARKKKIK